MSDYLSIRTILVAIDGSESSVKAGDYAIDLAKKNEAELIVLSIVTPKPSSDIDTMWKIQTTPRAIAQEEVDKVKQRAIGKNVSVNTVVLLKYISVIKEIVEYAENNGIDMIIIGSRGMTGFKKLLLGSVAGGVVTYSYCPVLVVR